MSFLTKGIKDMMPSLQGSPYSILSKLAHGLPLKGGKKDAPEESLPLKLLKQKVDDLEEHFKSLALDDDADQRAWKFYELKMYQALMQGVFQNEQLFEVFNVQKGGSPEISLESIENSNKFLIAINLSNMTQLQFEPYDDPEFRKNVISPIAAELISQMLSCPEVQGKDIVVTRVSLANTDASLRTFFSDRNIYLEGIKQSVRELNMNHTQMTDISIAHLHCFPQLEVLHMNFCKYVSGYTFKKNINSNRLRLRKLRVLSLLRSGSALSSVNERDFFDIIKRTCPQIKLIYKTPQYGKEKLHGISDGIYLQTLREPTRLACGHLVEKSHIPSLSHCPYDRYPIDPSNVLDFVPKNMKISLLDQEENDDASCELKREKIIKAELVDEELQPYTEKVFYHLSCGAVYNEATLDRLKAKEITCLACKEIFNAETLLEVFLPSLDSRVKQMGIEQTSFNAYCYFDSYLLHCAHSGAGFL